MFLQNQRRSLNTSVSYLHLSLQLIAAYWGMIFDDYPCVQQNVKRVTYVAYSMLIFNCILAPYLHYRTNTYKTIYYGMPFINLMFVGLILCFTIPGLVTLHNQQHCAHTRVIYTHSIIQTALAVLLHIFIMCASVPWSDRYGHWPGNLCLAVLLLSSYARITNALGISMLVIGILYVIISLVSFIINWFHSNTMDITRKKAPPLIFIFIFSLVVIFGCQIYNFIVLIMKSGQYDLDYHQIYARKTFVIFAAVNIVDFLFWVYGYQRLHAWITYTN